MSDIVENEEIDRDTVESEELERLFTKKYNLVSEIAISLKKSYINKLSVSKSLSLAVSLVDNSIEVYQLNKTSLSKVCRLSGHKKTITDVVFCPKNDNLVYSSSQDGLLKLWDTRTSGTCVQEYKVADEHAGHVVISGCCCPWTFAHNLMQAMSCLWSYEVASSTPTAHVFYDAEILKSYECMDVSQNGRVLCAGTQLVEEDAYLVFWDQRNPTPLGGYWNCHTDDITQVKFHKQKTEVLTTGSLDGLLNVFNITEQTEDDALIYSLNIENSVDKITWLDDARVSCITQSNDLQLWDTEKGDLLKSYSRDKIARAIKRSRDDDCYLVDTFVVDDATVVLAGSNAGDGDVLRSVTITEKKLQPTTMFTKNKQVVRCCWYDNDRDILITSGESGLISVWSRGEAPTNGTPKKLLNSMDKLHVNRHKPY